MSSKQQADHFWDVLNFFPPHVLYIKAVIAALCCRGRPLCRPVRHLFVVLRQCVLIVTG